MAAKVQPTKPKITLTKKTVKFIWRRVLLKPKDQDKDRISVWDDVEEVKLDQETIENMFEDTKLMK